MPPVFLFIPRDLDLMSFGGIAIVMLLSSACLHPQLRILTLGLNDEAP
jgi:hypothetical protein